MLVDRESHPFNRGKSIIPLLFVINISSVLHIPKFLEFTILKHVVFRFMNNYAFP